MKKSIGLIAVFAARSRLDPRGWNEKVDHWISSKPIL